jgi:hypothetical protein
MCTESLLACMIAATRSRTPRLWFQNRQDLFMDKLPGILSSQCRAFVQREETILVAAVDAPQLCQQKQRMVNENYGDTDHIKQSFTKASI